MVQKTFISADELLLQSVELAKKIYDSGFKPDFIVGIWRGGTPIGITVQEFFKYKGIRTDHIAIRTDGYAGTDKRKDEIQVYGLHYIQENANSENSLLLVDDVFDSGLSVKAVLDTLKKMMRKNVPQDIRIATPYFKPSRNKTNMAPDYYLDKTDAWLIFPHEFEDLTIQEIKDNKGEAFVKFFE